MRRRHRMKGDYSTTSAELLDPDERFVIRRAATWVRRILVRYPHVEYQTIELLAWLLGPEIHELGEELALRAEQLGRGESAEDLRECRFDASNYPRAIERFCARSAGGDVVEALSEQALRHLDRRLLELDTAEASHIEGSALRVQRAFGLTDLEREVFLLLFVIQGWSPVESFFENHLNCTSLEGRKYLSALLDASPAELADVATGGLTRAGIVEVNWGRLTLGDAYRSVLRDPLNEMMPGGLSRPVPPETLPLDAHAVEPAVTRHLLALLRSKAASAVHVLLYGKPGTGKSSYARALAHEVGLPALEVPADENDRAGARRLGIAACLRLDNEGEGVVVLVDEADGLLNTATSWVARGTPQDKAWLNELLEQPGARTIWIVNDVSGVEPSVLRRFAFSVPFEPLSKRQRTGLWDRVLRRRKVKRFFGDADIEGFAARYDVSAGVIDLAVRKAAERGELRRAAIHEAVTLALDAHLRLLRGGDRLDPDDADEVDDDDSLEGLTIDGDVEALLRRLEACDRALRRRDGGPRRGMNVLFHGPPGTGKSEVARYVATRLDRELMVKRASDILDPYVGMTERHLAESFAEAAREDAVLVIDEIDTLLFSRDAAHRSWEVSMTNEMLTQMERFRGVLICTTNRLSALDPASIRRFGDKIGFGYLTPEGNEVFYRKMLEPKAKGRLDEVSLAQLRSIANLAPGDFAIVRGRYEYTDEKPSHAELVAALEREAAIKSQGGGDRRIGF